MKKTIVSKRVNLFSVNQADYAKMIGVSSKVLSEIENGKGNYTESILQKASRHGFIRQESDSTIKIH